MIRLALVLLAVALPELAWAQEFSLDQSVNEAAATIAGDDAASTAVRLIIMLTTLSLLPAMLLVMTPFTRFIIVFALLRQAMGLQQSPPTQVLVGLALVLSFMTMQPTFEQIHQESVSPYMSGELTTGEAYDKFIGPMRTFMLRNTHKEDFENAIKLSKLSRPDSLDEVPSAVVVTGFVLSELKTAFIIGIKVYLPFLVVDMIVAAVLLGMGMMMLPPVIISLPFKLMVFVLMDGWGLLLFGMVSGVK
jgi:flagellar biosynthesis protein FliP